MAERWQVVSQDQITVPDPNTNGYVDAIRVRFITERGNRGYVDVPRAVYTVDNVQTLVDAHAAALDEVSDL